MKKILLIAGTRPNFIKLAPLYHTLVDSGLFSIQICHTGQHFDYSMSDTFWRLLRLPPPDFALQCTGSSSSEIVGKTVVALSEIVKKDAFDLVIIFGDVNATAAGAIVSAHNRVKLMHVEAGLRSFDRDMPEETNRIIADHLSDYLMVSEPSGLVNLLREGIDSDKVFFVGNIMIESLIATKPQWEVIPVTDLVADNEEYIVVTFHRPENVDYAENLNSIINLLKELSKIKRVIFPMHPRTKNRMVEFDLWKETEGNDRIIITEPMDYFRFLKVISKSTCVITDSGGVQEETSFLKIPCVTLRKNTERPVTISEGSNLLASVNSDQLIEEINHHIDSVAQRNNNSIEKWDNHVSERILGCIRSQFNV